MFVDARLILSTNNIFTESLRGCNAWDICHMVTFYSLTEVIYPFIIFFHSDKACPVIHIISPSLGETCF